MSARSALVLLPVLALVQVQGEMMDPFTFHLPTGWRVHAEDTRLPNEIAAAVGFPYGIFMASPGGTDDGDRRDEDAELAEGGLPPPPEPMAVGLVVDFPGALTPELAEVEDLVTSRRHLILGELWPGGEVVSRAVESVDGAECVRIESEREQRGVPLTHVAWICVGGGSAGVVTLELARDDRATVAAFDASMSRTECTPWLFATAEGQGLLALGAIACVVAALTWWHRRTAPAQPATAQRAR